MMRSLSAGRRPNGVRLGLGVTAAAVLGLTLAAAPAGARGASTGNVSGISTITHPAQPPVPRTVLTCTASTAKPITFDPPVRQEAQQVTARMTITLTNCTSPDNSHPRLRSGQLTLQGSGLATCTSVQNATGSGKITWKDEQGTAVGASSLRPNLNAIDNFNPTDVMLFGEITDGKMKGARTTGRAIPTTDISKCFTTGLKSVEGAGTVNFIRAN